MSILYQNFDKFDKNDNIGMILQPISVIFDHIWTISVLFLSYRFYLIYLIYQNFDTKRTVSVSSLSSLNKWIIDYRSKRERPFINFRRSLSMIWNSCQPLPLPWSLFSTKILNGFDSKFWTSYKPVPAKNSSMLSEQRNNKSNVVSQTR